MFEAFSLASSWEFPIRSICAAGALAGCVAASSASAGSTADAKPFEINVILCDSPEHAVAYAVAVDGGAAEEIAKDKVGRSAGMEACDRFFGLATVDEERVLNEKGVTYKVTSLRFNGVQRMKWMAQPLK
jgi:hypothetical protein